ncbi:MAG: hypothetical protein ACLP4V_08240, partial [Methylocella sp.]
GSTGPGLLKARREWQNYWGIQKESVWDQPVAAMVYHSEGRYNRRDKNSPQMWQLRHNCRRGPTKPNLVPPSTQAADLSGTLALLARTDESGNMAAAELRRAVRRRTDRADCMSRKSRGTRSQNRAPFVMRHDNSADLPD